MRLRTRFSPIPMVGIVATVLKLYLQFSTPVRGRADRPEGRQGKDSRTHLVSPVMAAAIAGHFVDVRSLDDVASVE